MWRKHDLLMAALAAPGSPLSGAFSFRRSVYFRVLFVGNAFPRLAADGKGLGEERVEALSAGHALLEFEGLSAQLIVGETGDFRFEGVDPLDHRPEPFQLPLVLAADDFLD